MEKVLFWFFYYHAKIVLFLLIFNKLRTFFIVNMNNAG